MPPERWRQINQVFYDALARSPAAREAFLAQACGADEALRQEVLSLLAAEAKPGALLEQPLGAVAADLWSDAPSTAPLAPLVGAQLGTYQIIQALGRGGMGEVFLAQDQKLKRRVALKLLPTRFTHDPERLHRFRQEARAASALNHPNILTIFDIGEENERHFMATEFVEGQTLRAALQHEGFAATQALDIAIQVASALDAAHRAGIIHRDIKPENIMLRPDGYVKVLDFGLAKLTEPSSANSGAASEAETRGADLHPSFETQTGVILGTVSYMSPEQARGQKVDARTDQFSLGVVLYEMLTGRRPFDGATRNHTLVAILDEEPPLLADYLAPAPPGLQRLLSRALAKERDARYPSSKDLLADLKDLRRELEFQAELARAGQPSKQKHKHETALIDESQPRNTESRTPNQRRLSVALIAIAALVLAVVSAFWYFNRRAPLTERDTILLTDFENRTGEAVFDGMLKQALAVQLGQTPFLNLFPEERVRETLRLMNRAPDSPVTREAAREICQRQGLKAWLSGSLASLGSNYVITLEAINGQSGETLASQLTEAASKEQVLHALGQAASELRAKLGESLRSIQRFDAQLEQATTSSLEALKAYSLGVQAGDQGKHFEAISLYHRAVNLDSSFALAYSGLAARYAVTAHPEQAAEAAEKAFALRERVTEREKFRIAETYYATVTGELDKLIETLELWARIYPNDYYPHNSLATNHFKFGRFEQGLEEARASLRLNPNFISARSNVALALLRLNRFDEAKATIEQAIEQKLDSATAHRTFYQLASLQGEAEAMKRQLAWLGQHSNEDWALYLQASTAASAGQLRQAQTLARQAVAVAAQRNFKELAATFGAGQMLNEASCGLCRQVRQDAAQTLLLSRACFAQVYFPVLPNVAFALALCGEVGEAQQLVDEMTNRCPKATMVKAIYLPIIRALVELQRGHPERAEQLLKVATPYDSTSGWGPTYLRGQAYLRLKQGAAAAAEFQKIRAHREWDLNTTFYPLAALGLARAAALNGDAAQARKAYQDFFAAWKNADVELPILLAARKEYEQMK